MNIKDIIEYMDKEMNMEMLQDLSGHDLYRLRNLARHWSELAMDEMMKRAEENADG